MECSICSKSFSTFTSLLTHKSEHENSVPGCDSRPNKKLVPSDSSKFKRLYSNKLKDFRKIRSESEKKIRTLNQQLNEFKTNIDDPNFSSLSDSVLNANLIESYFKINYPLTSSIRASSTPS